MKDLDGKDIQVGDGVIFAWTPLLGGISLTRAKVMQTTPRGVVVEWGEENAKCVQRVMKSKKILVTNPAPVIGMSSLNLGNG